MFPVSNDYDTACSVLQLKGSISLDIVKKRYKELSMLYHPDRYNEDKGKKLQLEAMKCINEAYQYIIDNQEIINYIKERCNYISKIYTMRDYCGEWHYKTNFKQSIITSYQMTPSGFCHY